MKQYPLISVLDTSIAAYNLGNNIIMDAVNDVLSEIFPNAFKVCLPSQDIKTNARHYNTVSDFTFVGGTNLLNGNIRKYRQWDLDLHNILCLRNMILLGCGWVQYEEQPITRYTAWAFSKILSNSTIHSVRDSYTCDKMNRIGIKCLNTGCPTLWKLTPIHLKQIPNKKSDNVIITLTDYNQNPFRDKKMIETIIQEYDRLFFFPQGSGDIIYLHSLGYSNRMEILSPTLEAFNKALLSGCDYIGTRLHAGIRALQLKRRSHIIGIDNRAIEMAKDFNLPVITHQELDILSQLINIDYSVELTLPLDNINRWKLQFER